MSWSVVLVDDEPTLRGLLKVLLRRDGRFEVVAEAGDGLAALTTIAAHDPDLVLLDLGLPGIDGLEVLERLGNPDRPRVVVLTGFSDEQTHQQALALGAAACLVKGSGFRGVTATLAEVAGGTTTPPTGAGGEGAGEGT